MGFNRSALVAGMIMHKLGTPGHEAVKRIRSKRPGALFNEVFAEYLTRLE
jgi:protein-tyrosine phosphatase